MGPKVKSGTVLHVTKALMLGDITFREQVGMTTFFLGMIMFF